MRVEEPFKNYLIISLGGQLKSQILANPLYLSLKDGIISQTVRQSEKYCEVYIEKCTQKSVE